MKFDRNRPFNNLPSLPPGADVESKPVLRQAVAASRALAELKGMAETSPNQALLVNALMLQEAKAGSEIDGVFATNGALFMTLGANAGRVAPATEEVLRYRAALWEGYSTLGKHPVLSIDLFIAIVRTIMNNKTGIRTTPGAIIKNGSGEKAVYTPPEGGKIIRDKLKNLEEFIHAEDGLDPLIKTALIQYQFEAIHPFPDGNGRAGRIITILFLIHSGLLNVPALCLSKAIVKRKDDYYRLLRRVAGKNRWKPWILFMLAAVEETAAFARERFLLVRDLMQETEERARRELPSRVYSKELIELLFRRPYCKIAFLVDAGIASRNIASDYLNELARINIVRKEKIGRETVYLNDRLYELLSK